MRAHVAHFFIAEEGAVTVDWVVLTAALCAFGIAVATTVADGATDASTGLGAFIGAQDVATY